MHPSGCVSRRDRIISGQRQLKRLSAARLHRKTDVIPDYNVTAVSRRFGTNDFRSLRIHRPRIVPPTTVDYFKGLPVGLWT